MHDFNAVEVEVGSLGLESHVAAPLQVFPSENGLIGRSRETLSSSASSVRPLDFHVPMSFSSGLNAGSRFSVRLAFTCAALPLCYHFCKEDDHGKDR
jgi:hypothetical protein